MPSGDGGDKSEMSRTVHGWICDTCGQFSETVAAGLFDESKPWICPVCKKETCSHCYSRYAVCKKCAATMTAEQCRMAAIDAGWDFDGDAEKE